MLTSGLRRYPNQVGSPGAFDFPPSSTSSVTTGLAPSALAHPWTANITFTVFRVGTFVGSTLSPFAVPEVVGVYSQTYTEVFDGSSWNFPVLSSSATATNSFGNGWTYYATNSVPGLAYYLDVTKIFAGVSEAAGYYYTAARAVAVNDTGGRTQTNTTQYPGATVLHGSTPTTPGQLSEFYIVGSPSLPVVTTPATVTSGGTSATITATWTAAQGVSGTDAYRLFRITSIGAGESRVEVYRGNATSYTDTYTGFPSLPYMVGYEVEAYAQNPANLQNFRIGTSARSITTIISAGPPDPPVPDPTAPTVTACQPCCKVQINLSWTTVLNATAYEIKRNGIAIAVVTELSYIDKAVTIGQTYTYMITGVNSAGSGTPGSSQAVTVRGWTEDAAPTTNWTAAPEPVTVWTEDGCGCC